LGIAGVEINQLNCTLERTIGVSGRRKREMTSEAARLWRRRSFIWRL
jgi:hypothetical protein